MLTLFQLRPLRRPPSAALCPALSLMLLMISSASSAQSGTAQTGYDDHKNMMDQLGIKALRRGPNPNDQSTFDEAKANPYKDSMPDVLRMKDGTKVTRAKQWPN